MIRFKVTGVKEIDAVLKGLPRQLTDKVLQTAHTAAAKPLINKAKLLAPEGPNGFLVDSIGVQKGSFNQVRSQQRNVGAIAVGPRRGRYKGFHAHLVEYGTRPRYTRGKGRKRRYKNAYRGIMPRKPFMEPAFQATRTQVVSSINTEIGKTLYRYMKRTLKQ